MGEDEGLSDPPISKTSLKLTERLEQQYCIKFCHKLGDRKVETIQKTQRVFSDDALGITQVKEWYDRFKDSHITVKSEPCSGWPSTCRIDQVIAKVIAFVMQDRCVTIREVAEEVCISTFSTHSLMTEDMAMKRVAVKFVPKVLTVKQKKLCVEVSQHMMYSTIIGSESYVYGYDL
ncbi:protein GVQW3-like [Palaemon carinicauda]|uniref:protein GVQW3-like n=1 Tax=Palaemon carinicauda TaxID=392227 RepID=UPI0035B627B4